MGRVDPENDKWYSSIESDTKYRTREVSHSLRRKSPLTDTP